jgi:hypothetical protein
MMTPDLIKAITNRKPVNSKTRGKAALWFLPWQPNPQGEATMLRRPVATLAALLREVASLARIPG